jgi:hypothetical protein
MKVKDTDLRVGQEIWVIGTPPVGGFEAVHPRKRVIKGFISGVTKDSDWCLIDCKICMGGVVIHPDMLDTEPKYYDGTSLTRRWQNKTGNDILHTVLDDILDDIKEQV